MVPNQESSSSINSTVSDETKTCDNCKTPVAGMYCSHCGQSVESTLKYFWTVILHILDDVFSFDSRASRTLTPLMLKPGFLTNEYIIGRRVHYVPPLRLYLFVSILFFLSLNFFAIDENGGVLNIGNTQDSVIKVSEHITSLEAEKKTASTDRLTLIEKSIAKFATYKKDLTEQKSLLIKGMASEAVDLEFDKIEEPDNFSEKDQKRLSSLVEQLAKTKRGEKTDFSPPKFTIGNNEDGSFSLDFLSDENNKKLDTFAKLLSKKSEKAFTEDPTPLIREAVEKLPQLMFILLPLFAALLKFMFIFSKRLYLEHLTVALHSHSFIFLCILLIQLIGLCQPYLNAHYPLLGNGADFLEVVIALWMPIYLFIMQKRVYRQGMLLTTIKYFIVGSLYMLMIVFTGAVAFIWGLAST